MIRDITNTGRDIIILKEQCRVYDVPDDGDCMLHCVAHAIFPPYRTGVFQGKKISKKEVVRMMRTEMLEKLDREYGKVLGGAFAESGQFVEEASIESLRALFKTNLMLGEETKVYLEHLIEKNILVVNEEGNAYKHYSYNKDYPSIVLRFKDIVDAVGHHSGHYNVVMWLEPSTGKQISLFEHDHPFINKLLK